MFKTYASTSYHHKMPRQAMFPNSPRRIWVLCHVVTINSLIQRWNDISDRLDNDQVDWSSLAARATRGALNFDCDSRAHAVERYAAYLESSGLSTHGQGYIAARLRLVAKTNAPQEVRMTCDETEALARYFGFYDTIIPEISVHV
jgi:hypothetical protein